MKTILIDPFAKSVSEVEYDGTLDGPNGAYKLLQCGLVEMFYHPSFPRGNVLYIDEEGRNKTAGRNGQAYFSVHSAAHPIAGRAMTAAYNPLGDTIESIITIEQLLEQVKWYGVLS